MGQAAEFEKAFPKEWAEAETRRKLRYGESARRFAMWEATKEAFPTDREIRWEEVRKHFQPLE